MQGKRMTGLPPIEPAPAAGLLLLAGPAAAGMTAEIEVLPARSLAQVSNPPTLPPSQGVLSRG